MNMLTNLSKLISCYLVVAMFVLGIAPGVDAGTIPDLSVSQTARQEIRLANVENLRESLRYNAVENLTIDKTDGLKGYKSDNPLKEELKIAQPMLPGGPGGWQPNPAYSHGVPRDSGKSSSSSSSGSGSDSSDLGTWILIIISLAAGVALVGALASQSHR